MKKILLIFFGLLLSMTGMAKEQYFELRANANLYSDASRKSERITHITYSGSKKPQILHLIHPKRKDGYYFVETVDKSNFKGWIYKTYVRSYEGVIDERAENEEISVADFGECKEVFYNGKPPVAPQATTPLCEKENGVVFFASGYSKKENHGAWSAYRLNQKRIAEINEGGRDRPKIQFRQNPQLDDGQYVQPRHSSYTNTDWDRGHLAPNGAMAWDDEAQKRSFSISNIAPQKPAMNRNIWRCFEVSIREWADNPGDTYVIVGTIRGNSSISSENDPNQIQINVPSKYIAMVFRTKPSPMAVGVMVPNEEGHLDIRENMMSVSDLEKMTGYRFNLPTAVSKQMPNFNEWPTRIVKKELLGKLPSIDTQCPVVRGRG